MKKILAAAIVSFLPISFLLACTTFFITKNGRLVFGRNYDWVTDAGLVCTNLKGLSKISMQTENGETISWISQYGSITFNQYGKEFPTGGMNEKGLIVELMWLDETKYPSADKRPAIGVLQWIQYQLDNCATIDEVIATDKKLRISPTGTTPLHYLIADANGKAATIEFLNGQLVVHKGSDLSFPVLTNNIYDESVRAYKNSSANGNNSLERFNDACSMIQKLNSNSITKPLVDYAFDILGEVAQGNFTKWSIVYDITNKTIQFKTNRFKQIKTVSFSAFDFSCSSIPKVWDMSQTANGSINNLFQKFNNDINKRIVETAAKESESNVPISQENREILWQYALKIKCQ
ncbi:MAG TPA: linear amide C-N hydrolase [Chitinophagaceae bacterium]|jgi:choloylglycine hydrolase|nr:linear amide C-N hydrolase [Chitinophagaceae bacterium]